MIWRSIKRTRHKYERRGKSSTDDRRTGRRGPFRQSRHLGNAFYRGARQSRGHESRVRSFRRCGAGTADGYGPMAEKPAVTLLHLGPDLIGFHFTPRHASWLNQIEIWFSILVRKLLRRASFTSKQDLKARIEAFIAYFNRTLAKPFKWTMTGKPLAA